MLAGVQVGDIVTQLEGNDITDFQNFQPFLNAVGRPVRIRFGRGKKKTETLSKPASVPAPSSSSAVPESSVFSMSSDLFKSIAAPFAGAPKASQPPATAEPQMTEEEKQARRDRLSKAANDRSWDSKLQAKKAAGRKPVVAEEAEEGPPLSQETLLSIERSKQGEQAIEKQMGYSPFRPHMSFASPVTAEAGPRGLEEVERQVEVPGLEEGPQLQGLEAQVDAALARLLSLGDADRAAGRTALQTVHRMLANLALHSQDPKFRSVRLANEVFQRRVGAVPGGLELLQAAGYCPQPPGFLTHPAEEPSLRALRYTSLRIAELLEAP